MVFGVFSSNWEADDLPTNLFWLSSSLRLWPQEHKLTKPSLAHQPHLPEFRGGVFNVIVCRTWGEHPSAVL